MTEIVNVIFKKLVNIVGKGENAGYQRFPFLPQCFERASLLKLLNVRTMP